MKKIIVGLFICLILSNMPVIKDLKAEKIFANGKENTIPKTTENKPVETVDNQVEKPTESIQTGQSIIKKEQTDIDKNTEITVLYDGNVVTMNLYDYLYGVVCAEIPASFPKEAIKAPIVAART